MTGVSDGVSAGAFPPSRNGGLPLPHLAARDAFQGWPENSPLLIISPSFSPRPGPQTVHLMYKATGKKDELKAGTIL